MTDRNASIDVGLLDDITVNHFRYSPLGGASIYERTGVEIPSVAIYVEGGTAPQEIIYSGTDYNLPDDDRLAYFAWIQPQASGGGGGTGYAEAGLTAVRIDLSLLEDVEVWDQLEKVTLDMMIREYFSGTAYGEQPYRASNKRNNMNLVYHRARGHDENRDLPSNWSEMIDQINQCNDADTHVILPHYEFPLHLEGWISQDVEGVVTEYVNEVTGGWYRVDVTEQVFSAVEDYRRKHNGCDPACVFLYFSPPSWHPSVFYENNEPEGVRFSHPTLSYASRSAAYLRNQSFPCPVSYQTSPGGGWLENIALTSRATTPVKANLVSPLDPVVLQSDVTSRIDAQSDNLESVITLSATSLRSEGSVDKILEEIRLISRTATTRVLTFDRTLNNITLNSTAVRVVDASLTVNLDDVILSSLVLPPPPVERESPFLDATRNRIFVGDTDETFRSSS